MSSRQMKIIAMSTIEQISFRPLLLSYDAYKLTGIVRK